MLLFVILHAGAFNASASEKIAARISDTRAGADVIYVYGHRGPKIFVSSRCVGAGYPRLRVFFTSDHYDDRATMVRSARDQGDADIVLCVH